MLLTVELRALQLEGLAVLGRDGERGEREAVRVGLTIANDTQSVELDTAAFDANIEKLLALGYRDIKLPIPACNNGGSCSFSSYSIQLRL